MLAKAKKKAEVRIMKCFIKVLTIYAQLVWIEGMHELKIVIGRVIIKSWIVEPSIRAINNSLSEYDPEKARPADFHPYYVFDKFSVVFETRVEL